MGIVLISSLATNTDCNPATIKQSLRHALSNYFEHPSTAALSESKIRDLLTFYLGIKTGQSTIDCTQPGRESKIPINQIITQTHAITSPFPTCTDQTPFGECSTAKPKYCYAGSLLNRCTYCGCPDGSSCQAGKCIPTPSPPENQTKGCTYSRECPHNQICIERTCQKVISCKDSDGGASITSLGKITINYSISGRRTLLDYCQDQTTLTELNCHRQEGVEEIAITCPPDTLCVNGACTSCGNRHCTNGETCTSCPQDCGTCSTGNNLGEITYTNSPMNRSLGSQKRE